MVDEYLKNWQEVYEWMVSDPSKTSCVLTVLSSSMNATLEIHFDGIFPTNLSEIAFDSTTTDPTYVTGTITFQFSSYTIKRLVTT